MESLREHVLIFNGISSAEISDDRSEFGGHGTRDILVVALCAGTLVSLVP